MKSISFFYISMIPMIGNLLLFSSLFSMDESDHDRKKLIIKNESDRILTIKYQPRHIAMGADTYLVTTIQPRQEKKLIPLLTPLITFKIKTFENKKDVPIIKFDFPIIVSMGIDGNIKIMQENVFLTEMRRIMPSISSSPEERIKDEKKSKDDNCFVM